MSGVTTQRPGKMKGRRSDRAGGARASKTPAGDSLAHLLAPNSAGVGVYNNPPLAHTLVSLIGCVVEVQMTSGKVYEGILRAISPNMEISLNVAHVKVQPPTMDSVYDRIEVRFADVVTISAKTGTNPQLDIFKTDGEISGHTNGPQSRELQPFTDFSGDGVNLDVPGGSEGDGWSVEEMFAVNKNKFKVSSTYDDELPQYTTPLARDGEGYKEREMEAIQLANEIESRNMYSRRGMDDLGSEEDRWSSVLREPERSQVNSLGSGLVVKENGSHTLTSSHSTKATPTSTPPSLAPLTSSPSPSPLVPPSPQTNSPADSETTPPAPPTSSQLPGNNETNSSDIVVSTDEAVDNLNEGKPPEVSSERVSELSQASVAPSLADTKEGAGPAGEGGSEELQPVSLQSTAGEEREGEKKDDEETEEAPPVSVPEPAKAEKEQAIKNFKLDPTAKEFVLNSPLTFVPSPLTSSSSLASSATAGSPSSTHAHARTHPHTPRSGGARYPGNNSPRVRPSASSNVYTHTSFATPEIHTAVSSSYMLTQQPTGGGMAGLLRPSLHTGFSQYGIPPGPLMGGVMPQFIASPHSSMIGGVAQQQFPIMQQPQLFQHTQTVCMYTQTNSNNF
jgi:small nuclear ribonucleoprotein (snRNP)-like protein